MTRYRAASALFLALIAVTATSLPVRGGFVLMQYFGFDVPGARGTVQVERPRDPDAASKVYVALAGLNAGTRYRLSFSPDACSTPAAAATEIVGKWVTASADGTVFVSSFVTQHYHDFLMVRSLRLMEEEGIFYACRAVSDASAAGSETPDGASAQFVKNGFRGTLRLHRAESGRLGMVVVLSALAGSTRYQIVHSPLSCTEFQEGDPDQPIVIGGFRSSARGLSVYEKEQEADVVAALGKGSLRIARRGSSAVWGCANLTRFVDG